MRKLAKKRNTENEIQKRKTENAVTGESNE